MFVSCAATCSSTCPTPCTWLLSAFMQQLQQELSASLLADAAFTQQATARRRRAGKRCFSLSSKWRPGIMHTTQASWAEDTKDAEAAVEAGGAVGAAQTTSSTTARPSVRGLLIQCVESLLLCSARSAIRDMANNLVTGDVNRGWQGRCVAPNAAYCCRPRQTGAPARRPLPEAPPTVPSPAAAAAAAARAARRRAAVHCGHAATFRQRGRGQQRG